MFTRLRIFKLPTPRQRTLPLVVTTMVLVYFKFFSLSPELDLDMSAPGSCSPIWAPHIAYHDDGSLTESSFLTRTLVRHTDTFNLSPPSCAPVTKQEYPRRSIAHPILQSVSLASCLILERLQLGPRAVKRPDRGSLRIHNYVGLRRRSQTSSRQMQKTHVPCGCA